MRLTARKAFFFAFFVTTIGIIKLRLWQATGWCITGKKTETKIGHSPHEPYFWQRELDFDCNRGTFLAGVAVGFGTFYLQDNIEWRCTDGLTTNLDNDTDYDDAERAYFGAGILAVTALVDTGEITWMDDTIPVAARIHNLRFYGIRFVWNGEAMVEEYHEAGPAIPRNSPYDTDFMETRCPENTSASGVYMIYSTQAWEITLKCTNLNKRCTLPDPPDYKETPAPTVFPTPQPSPYPTTLAPTNVPTGAPFTPAPQRARIPPGTVRTPSPTLSPTYPAPTVSPTRPLTKESDPFFTKTVIIVIASTSGVILVMTCIICYFCLTTCGYVDPIKICSGDDDNVYQPEQAPSAFRADVPDISDDWAVD